MTPDKKFRLSALKTPLILMGVFWALAIGLWQLSGAIFYLFNFLYIGTSLGVGMGTYALLPKQKKYQGQKLSQLLIGVYMLGFLGFFARENMQIEGFFVFDTLVWPTSMIGNGPPRMINSDTLSVRKRHEGDRCAGERRGWSCSRQFDGNTSSG